MSFKTKLLGSASAMLLIGAASGTAFADESVQNGWEFEKMDPGHVTIYQKVEGNNEGPDTTDDGSRRVNTIDGDYSNGMTGLSKDQQNNGHNNAMGVTTNVILNTAGPGDDDLAQNLWIKGKSRNGNYIDDPANSPEPDNAVRTNLISNAYQDVQGVVDVQQNNGDGNVLGIGNAVSANLGAEPFGQNGQDHNDTSQKVRVSGRVDNNHSTDANYLDGSSPFVVRGERLNTVDGDAFQNFLGLSSVQQNNGNGNVIQAGTAVIADIGTAEDDVEDSNAEEASLWVQADGKVKNSSANSSSAPGPSLPPPDRENTITSAFTGSVKGIVNVQQNNGDNNSMNVANGVRVTHSTFDDIDDVHANNVWAIGKVKDNVATDSHQNRNNAIDGGSFAGAAGMFTVQQNNGDNNAMNSANGVVAAFFAGKLSSEDVMAGAGAKAKVKGNTATVTQNTDRMNTINEGAFNDATGIATVQQNNGDNNVINAAKAIVVTVGGEGHTGFNGNIMADTALTATVTGNTVVVPYTSVPPGYENVLTNSFQGFKGIKTVQQNNGNNNAIQSSVTVVGNLGQTGPGQPPVIPPVIPPIGGETGS